MIKRIITKDGQISKRFKLSKIVWGVIGELRTIRDVERMEPNSNKNLFAEECLKAINELYSQENQNITKRNMQEPEWKTFRDKVALCWHRFKQNNPFLRSYRHAEKGYLWVRIDDKTPKRILDKLGLQSEDRIRLQIEKHNNRILYDKKLLGGDEPAGFIGK